MTLTFLLSRGFNSPPDGSNVNSLKACKINRILSLALQWHASLTLLKLAGGDHDLLTLQRLQLPARWLKCKLTKGLQNKQNIILNSSMTPLTDFAETGWKVTLTYLVSRGFNSPPDGSNVNSLKACKINRILSLTLQWHPSLTLLKLAGRWPWPT